MILIDKNYSKYISKEINTNDAKKILFSLKEEPVEIVPSPESSISELIITDKLDENGYLLLQYSTGNYLIKVSDVVEESQEIFFENIDPLGDGSLIDAISLTTKNLEVDNTRVFNDHLLSLNMKYIEATLNLGFGKDLIGRYYLGNNQDNDVTFYDYIKDNILPYVDEELEVLIIGSVYSDYVNNSFYIPTVGRYYLGFQLESISNTFTNSFSMIHNQKLRTRTLKINNFEVEKLYNSYLSEPYKYSSNFSNIIYIGFFNRELTDDERNQFRFGTTTTSKQLKIINIKNEIPKIYYINTNIDLIEKDLNKIVINNKNEVLNPFKKTNDTIVLLSDNGISNYLDFIYLNKTNKVEVKNVTTQEVTIDTINDTGILNEYLILKHRYTLDETLEDELGGESLELTDDANEQYEDAIFGKGFKFDGTTGLKLNVTGNVISFWLKVNDNNNDTSLFNKGTTLRNSYIGFYGYSSIYYYKLIENDIFYNITLFEVNGECIVYINGIRTSSTFYKLDIAQISKTINGVIDNIEIFDNNINNIETADVIAKHLYNRTPFYQTIIEFERQIKTPEIVEIKENETNKQIKAEIENGFTNTSVLYNLNENTEYINYELTSVFGNKKIYDLNLKLFK